MPQGNDRHDAARGPALIEQAAAQVEATEDAGTSLLLEAIPGNLKAWIIRLEQCLSKVGWHFFFFKGKEGIQFPRKNDVFLAEILRKHLSMSQKSVRILLHVLRLFFKFVHTHMHAP